MPLGSLINIGEKIGEGGSASVYKAWYMMRPMAIKQFKNKISKRKTIKVSEKLLGLKQENINEFLGYSFKPTAFGFENFELIIDGEVINNASELLEMWNDDDNFNFEQRLDILIQALKGLQFLHDKKIIQKWQILMIYMKFKIPFYQLRRKQSRIFVVFLWHIK